MKLLNIVFCVVILICATVVASAENIVTEDTFDYSGQSQVQQVFGSTTHLNLPYYINNIYINDVVTIQGLNSIIWEVETSWLRGNDLTSEFDTTCVFTIDGDTVGTGIFGYNSVASTGKTYIQLHIWEGELNIGSKTGAKVMYISSNSVNDLYMYGTSSWPRSGFFPNDPPNAGNAYAFFGMNEKYVGSGEGQTSEITINSDYDDSYPFTYTSSDNLNLFNMERDVTNTTWGIITIGGVEEYNDTALQTTELDFISYDKTNDSWSVSMENVYGDVVYKTLTFLPTAITSVGSISLNQTSYTEPELIQIDAELTTYDFSGHAYTTYLQWRDDVGNWNTVSYVEYNESIGFFTDDPTKSIIGDIDFYKYEIPLRLRAVLIDFNKNTYVSTTIAESNTVLYNPPAGALYLVTGTVVNADTDAVVSGATVSVTGPMSQSDTTNVNGRFYLYLADGTYTFNTTKSGYEDNIDTGIIINSDTSGIEIPLVPVQTDAGVVYGTITDSDTKNPLNDVHVIFSNATDTIHAYSASNGYYEAEGFNNDSVYAVRALKTGYYSYNGSITTETSGATHKSFDMVQTNYSATPTPTSVSTYPGGEGYEWTNDDIVTMLRILVPGIFLMMLIFLLLAVMMGFMPNNGGNQGGNSGLGELWRRK